MQTNSQFQYINEINFKNISNWSAGTILHSTLMYKEGVPLVPISDLISRNREKEIIEDDKSYKQVTIKLYGKGVIQRGDDLVLGKNIGTKNQYRISEGQFIMSKIDARNGAFGIVPKELQNAITTQDFLSYNINHELILPQFFVLLTATKQFNDLCQKASSGTTGRQRVDEKAFLGFEIPVPNKSEQEEIIKRYNSKVDVADTLSIKANHLEKKSVQLFLEKLKLSPLNKASSKKRFELYRFKEIRRWDVFSADNTIYSELKKSPYPIHNLGETYSFVKRSWNRKNERENQFEYIELGGVDSLHGIYETKTIETAKAPSRATQTVQTNDLIIGTTRPYLKRFAIVHSKYNDNICSSGFAVIEPKDEYSLPFLKMYLESEYGLEQLKNQMSGALYPAITMTKLKGILIPSLSKKQQDEIAGSISSMKQKVIELRNESLNIKANANKEFASEIFN